MVLFIFIRLLTLFLTVTISPVFKRCKRSAVRSTCGQSWSASLALKSNSYLRLALESLGQALYQVGKYGLRPLNLKRFIRSLKTLENPFCRRFPTGETRSRGFPLC